MTAKENESLEEQVQIFHYNLQRFPYGTLPGEVIKETRTRSGMRTSLTRNNNITNGGATRAEVGNILENFKIDILSTLTTQLDVLQAKQKQAEAEQTLAIFFHRCRKKHGSRECPLDMVQVYVICTKYHDTEQCPSLPGLKYVFREAEEEI